VTPPDGGRVIGIDPGRAKCGYAVIAKTGERLALEVIPITELERRVSEDNARGPIAMICIGHATNSREIERLCRERWPAIPRTIVNETNTSLEARSRYFDEHPPKGLMRLIPRGLLAPKEPLDGYAALIIIERWMAASRGKPSVQRPIE
jgi:RNase H-fold protein (predicted Holliday junction resolvase)